MREVNYNASATAHETIRCRQRHTRMRNMAVTVDNARTTGEDRSTHAVTVYCWYDTVANGGHPDVTLSARWR